MKPGGSMPHSQGHSNNSYPKLKQTQFLVLIPIALRSILILSTHLRLDLRKRLFPVGLPIKILKHPDLPPFWLHDLPISIF